MSALVADFLVTFTAFDKTWDAHHLKYGLFSNAVRAAHCDGAFLKYSMSDRFQADYLTTCGEICTELQEQFAGPVPTAFRVNPMDHTQVIVFASNATGGTPITGVSAGPKVQVFVSFRGTQFWDVINNRRNLYFQFWPVTLCGNCEAHKGFWRNFVSLRPEIQPSITEVAASIPGMSETSCNVLTTGMSMGAPLASLAGYHLKKMGHDPKGIITFGSPRVGNLELAKAIASTVSLITGFAYLRDPVPHVPPRMVGFRSAQTDLFHIAIEPTAWVKAELGEKYDFSSYVLYSATYTNTVANAWAGDKEFAGATYSYQFADHFGYFSPATQAFHMDACGTTSESFVKNDKATELFI